MREASRRLNEAGKPVSVLKLTRIRPLDPDSIRAALSYKRILFFEEGIRSGGVCERFGAKLLNASYRGLYQPVAIDTFVPACKPERGLAANGLDLAGILAAVQRRMPDAAE